MASESLTQEQRARLQRVVTGGAYGTLYLRNGDVEYGSNVTDAIAAALDTLTAVTAERDRLREALARARGYESAEHFDTMMAAFKGHPHPRPCSICRREDCTTEHACE